MAFSYCRKTAKGNKQGDYMRPEQTQTNTKAVPNTETDMAHNNRWTTMQYENLH